MFIGGFGIDFSQNSPVTSKEIDIVAKGLLSHGVTAFCPTIVTSPLEIYKKVHSSLIFFFFNNLPD